MSSGRFSLAGEPRKIAVLRANAIGDFVFALPALAALRARFPAAEIVLLGLPWHQEFLAGRPGAVDRVIALPKVRGVGAPEWFETDSAKLEDCLRTLRAEAFDLAVQIHGGGRHSNAFLRQIGACRTIGLRTPDAAELDAAVPYVYWQSEILRMLEVVALVGAKVVSLTPELAVTSEDLAEAHAACGLPRDRLVAIHPGAGDPRRRWPLDRFVCVAEALRDRGYVPVVVGGSADTEAGEALVTALRGCATNLAGRLSLRGLVGLLAEARLFVGNDSGPLHIAEAVGTPTVGIYWCGNIVNADPITRATHRPVLSWRNTCPVCGAGMMDERCEHDVSFADLAPLPEVLDHVFDLLARPGRTCLSSAPV